MNPAGAGREVLLPRIQRLKLAVTRAIHIRHPRADSSVQDHAARAADNLARRPVHRIRG